MSLRKRLLTFFLGFASIGTVTALYAPEVTRSQPLFPGGRAIVFVPTFRVMAVSFKAIDETGWDWTGADEVYAVVSDFDPAHTNEITEVYEDVDTGETHNFLPGDRCIAPARRCASNHGVSEILHFAVAFWERDKLPLPEYKPGTTGYELHHGLHGEDDSIGLAEVLMSREQLVAALPTVGASVDRKLIVTRCAEAGCGSGTYELTYRITRLRDGKSLIVVAPPGTSMISLEARSTGPGGGVLLVWSGATTNDVDIYRDGASLVTTANDGSHTDTAGPGNHRYRVCNTGSTTECSAEVSVNVL